LFTEPRTFDTVLAAPRSTWALFLGAVLFAALTGVGAAASVPLWFSPVPVTLQTLFVVLAGALLGPVWGPVSQVLYVGAGVLGLPVFAQGAAGPGVLAGPTGGYLVGFVAGAWIAGLITRPGASWLRLVLGFAAAHAAVFVCGLSHLMLFTAQSPALAVKLGLLPFLPGLAVKLAASVGIVRSRRLAGWFRP
jgi:biotin transport system substrate-specific component